MIENSQRDINIAFVNELSKIFTRMGIDTQDVLEAASTKWNFLPFKPGLVGGHCIGVDPYYLAQCAQRYGYNPEIILAGRRMNDGMGEYVANQVVKLMNISVYDPWANPMIVEKEYSIKTTNELLSSKFDAVILAVAHEDFENLDINRFVNSSSVIYDVKGVLNSKMVAGRL